MIDEEWSRPPQPPSIGITLQVAVVVPLPNDAGGAGEVLTLSAFGSAKLPVGEPRRGERLTAAAERIALGTTGARVAAERVVYIHEAAGRQVTVCVLCALDAADDADARPGVRFVSPARWDDDFEPVGVRELLVEDLHGGFVRPIAYLIARRDEFGREQVDVTW